MKGKIYCIILGYMSIFCMGWEIYTAEDRQSVVYTIRFCSLLIIMVISFIFRYVFDALEKINETIKNKE